MLALLVLSALAAPLALVVILAAMSLPPVVLLVATPELPLVVLLACYVLAGVTRRVTALLLAAVLGLLAPVALLSVPVLLSLPALLAALTVLVLSALLVLLTLSSLLTPVCLSTTDLVVWGVPAGEVVLPLLVALLSLSDPALIVGSSALAVVFALRLWLGALPSLVPGSPPVVPEVRRLLALRARHDGLGPAGPAFPAAGPAAHLLVALLVVLPFVVSRSVIVVSHG